MIHLAVNMDSLAGPIVAAMVALALAGLFLLWVWAKLASKAKRSRAQRRTEALALQQTGQLENSMRIWVALKSSSVRLLVLLPILAWLSPNFPPEAEGLPGFLDSGPFSTQTKVLLSVLALTFVGLLARELHMLRPAPPSEPGGGSTTAHCG